MRLLGAYVSCHINSKRGYRKSSPWGFLHEYKIEVDFSLRLCRTHEKQNGQVCRRSLFRDHFFADSDTVTRRCANALQVSTKVAAWLHDEKKVYLCYERRSRRSNSCTEDRNSAKSLAEDYARDGGYTKGDYSISTSMGICICICMGIGIASIVCVSIKFEGMSIIIHESKHRFHVSIILAM